MEFKVRLLKTIKNNGGDIFRKGSVLMAEKSYGGYRLTKNKKRKNGCIITVTRVKKDCFELIK